MQSLLVVEDETDIAELLRSVFSKEGWNVGVANTGLAALSAVRREPPDLIVLDWMLPELSGIEVLKEIRRHPDTRMVPVIMLTARHDEIDRVLGLELGADDYVTKPFSPKELAARVTALLRRASRPAASDGILRYGPIIIDADRHAVTVSGEEVRLTAKEFLLLQYLLQHRGRVLSRDLLLTDVWGYQYTGGTRTVDVHIRRLREKMPVLADAIETVKQFGYKLIDPP